MKRTKEGRALAARLRPLLDRRFFAHLDVLAEDVAEVRLEQVGPGRQAPLVAETVDWRRHDKDRVDLLRAAATGSLADRVELRVIKAVDHAIRSSSAVECINSRVWLVQVARKRLSEDFLYLLAVYHNMHQFGRGSGGEGRSPAELAGIELSSGDWIEVLDTAAHEPVVAAGCRVVVPGEKAA